MLLERIIELGLLEVTPAATVSTYPLETQKRIVGECAGVFAAGEYRKLPLSQALDTVNILACGVDFPLEDIQLTMQVVTILSSWLLEPSKILSENSSPNDISALRDCILRGLSGIFREKQGNKGEMLIGELQSHVDLCRKILNLLFLLPHTLQEDTIALRVLIGASDYLLGKPLLPYCYLADELADYLTGTLLEVFLKRGQVDKELWDCVGNRFSSWLNRLPVANCWNVAIVALAQSYVNSENQKAVLELSWKGQNVEIVSSRDFVKQALFRLVHFVGDLSQAFPSVVVKIVSGIDRVINLMLPLNTQANTLMALFGKPLSQVVFREDCPDAKGNALGILCQIMCRTRNDQVIRPEYLGLFYTALRKALKREQRELAEGELFSAIMAVLHGEEVLRLPGARILFEDFLVGCMRIVPRLQGKLTVQYEADDLRRTTFRLLSQLSVISAHFDDSLHQGQKIESILLESLQAETNVENSTYLMNILTMHSVAHHQGPNERLGLIKTVVLKTEQASPVEVSMIGTSALSCLRSLLTPSILEEEFEKLCQIGQKVLKRNDLAHDFKFLTGLLEFLVDQIDVMTGKESLVIDLLAQAMGFNQQRQQSQHSQQSNNKSTEQRHVGLDFLRNEATLEAHQREKALKEFAEGQLCRLLHRKQPESVDEDWPHQRHYKLFNSSVLSVAVQNGVVQVVIRNRAGRFVWYFTDEEVEAECSEGELLIIRKEEPLDFEQNERFEQGDVYNGQFLESNIPVDQAFGAFCQFTATQQEVSVKYKKDNLVISERELGKILLSRLGLSHILLNQRESVIQEAPKDIDVIPRNYQFSCGCLFAKSGREEAEGILAATQLSNDYVTFINSLQDQKLKLLVPQSLPAVMESGPLELPNGQPVNATALQAFNYVQRVPVMVVWLEDLEGMTSIPSKLGLEALIYVCICPVMEGASDGLYRIRLMVASEDAGVRLLFGPLIDGCLVKRENLDKLVRDTIISFSYQQHNNPYLHKKIILRCRILSRAEGIRELKAKAIKVLSDLMQPKTTKV